MKNNCKYTALLRLSPMEARNQFDNGRLTSVDFLQHLMIKHHLPEPRFDLALV